MKSNAVRVRVYLNRNSEGEALFNMFLDGETLGRHIDTFKGIEAVSKFVKGTGGSLGGFVKPSGSRDEKTYREGVYYDPPIVEEAEKVLSLDDLEVLGEVCDWRQWDER